MAPQDKTALKATLVHELRPLTEADPDVLADYVVALLENTEAGADFDTQMASKLEDFLGTNTNSFVKFLGRMLRGESPPVQLPIQSQNPHIQNHQQQRQLCFNWQKGYCPRGNRCNFAHPMTIPEEFLAHGALPPLPPPVLRPIIKRARPTANSLKLIVDKIPAESCNIAAIHAHFSQFGTIVNIDLMPDLARARLQFSSHEEARAAHGSPEVIFNNRFVKVYWEDEDDGSLISTNIPIPVARQHSVYRPIQTVPFKAPPNPQEELARKRKEALEAYLNLRKQKESLLLKYIEQQKSLLARLESTDLDDVAKTKLIEELRVVDSTITNLKAKSEEPKTSPSAPILKGGPIRSKVQQQQPKPAFQPYQHQPRDPASFKLDLRPKTIRMAPIPPKLGSDPASIRKFFEPFGQINNLKVEDDLSAASATFTWRSDAEKAMTFLGLSEHGCTFTWIN